MAAPAGGVYVGGVRREPSRDTEGLADLRHGVGRGIETGFARVDQ